MATNASNRSWVIFRSRLLRRATAMPKTQVEIAFDEAVEYYRQNDGEGWPDLITTIADGFKRLARREYVYRTQLRETFTELTELKKRVSKLERYAAAIEGFDDDTYTEVEDVEAVKNCVYIIRDVDISGFYKIGVANEFKRRLRELTISPFRVKVVHVIPTDNPYSLER